MQTLTDYESRVQANMAYDLDNLPEDSIIATHIAGHGQYGVFVKCSEDGWADENGYRMWWQAGSDIPHSSKTILKSYGMMRVIRKGTFAL